MSAGYYRQNLNGDLAYQSFVPNPLPPEFQIDGEMFSLLIEANKNLAALDAVARRIPDARLFTAAYVCKEALLSSQIEGTQATLEDVLNPLIDTNANCDVEEVVNYVRATEYAVERMRELPLCNRLIRETHRVLMQGARGQDKTPGEFRRSQNWIGGHGVSLIRAKYIPPNVQDMIRAMSDLEKYINAEDDTNALIRAALAHYQFETIHPFLDGNGRIGRLLIVLILLDRKILSTPALYLSYFLKKYRTEYYARLSDVRLKGNFEQWIKFFLRAINESSLDAIQTIDDLTALRNKNEAAVKALGGKVRIVFDYLWNHPIISINKTSEALGLSRSTTSRTINKLVAVGILSQVQNNARNKIFAYESYIEIFRRNT